MIKSMDKSEPLSRLLEIVGAEEGVAIVSRVEALISSENKSDIGAEFISESIHLQVKIYYALATSTIDRSPYFRDKAVLYLNQALFSLEKEDPLFFDFKFYLGKLIQRTSPREAVDIFREIYEDQSAENNLRACSGNALVEHILISGDLEEASMVIEESILLANSEKERMKLYLTKGFVLFRLEDLEKGVQCWFDILRSSEASLEIKAMSRIYIAKFFLSVNQNGQACRAMLDPVLKDNTLSSELKDEASKIILLEEGCRSGY